MKKLLLILAVISFALPLFYYHWAHSVVYEFQESNNYFVEEFDLMHYHIFIEGGLGLLPFLSFILGGILLFIRSKFFPQFPQYWYCGLDDTRYTDVDDTSVQDSTS